MKTIIRLTECPHCKRPLAAVHPPDELHGYFVPIDGLTINLGAPGLIWCDACGNTLPVAVAANTTEAQP